MSDETAGSVFGTEKATTYTRRDVVKNAAIAGAAFGLLGPLIAACGGSGTGGAGATTSSGEKPLIGFTLRFISGNVWLQEVANYAKIAGEKLGYRVEALDGRADAQLQVQQMQSFITRGAKAILVEPIDAQALSAGIYAARDAKIPVICVNDQLSEDLANQIAGSVHDDGHATCVMVGEEVAKAVAAKYKPSDTVKLYIMAILPNEPLTQNRESGFMEGYEGYFKSNPGPKTIRIPDGYGMAAPDKTLPVMRDKLSANPDLNVLFSMTDTVHGAVLQTLIEAGFVNKDLTGNGIIVGGFDARMEVVKAMATVKGFPWVVDGLDQPAAQAAVAIKAANAAIKGEPLTMFTGTPPTCLIPPGVVTTENAATFVNDDLEFAANPESLQ